MGKRQKRGRKSSRRNPDRLEILLEAMDNIQIEDIEDIHVYIRLTVV